LGLRIVNSIYKDLHAEMKAANSSGPIVTTKLKAGNMPASRFTLDLGLQSGWSQIWKLLLETPEEIQQCSFAHSILEDLGLCFPSQAELAFGTIGDRSCLMN